MVPDEPEDAPVLEPLSEPIEDEPPVLAPPALEPPVLAPPDDDPLDAANAGAAESISADIKTATCLAFIIRSSKF